MSDLAQAIIVLTAKYGPVLVANLIDVANKPKPTRADYDALFADIAALDYNNEIKAAVDRAAAK